MQNLTPLAGHAKVFAPVNIAWIKYMGKFEGQPSNASLSMTLDHIGTTTEIDFFDVSENAHHQAISGLAIDYSESPYVPPLAGQKKIKAFLEDHGSWKALAQTLGYPYFVPRGIVKIRTENSVPAGTGIATSASGFAALTLAWAEILFGGVDSEWRNRYANEESVRMDLARQSKRGSGSACRSFLGPFVEWRAHGELRTVRPTRSYTDFILLIDSKPKKVASSEAHLRVITSPQFSGRVDRAHARLEQLKTLLINPAKVAEEQIAKIVYEEALDMHDLFHTASEPFSYITEESKLWIDKSVHFGKMRARLPIVTLDAGANVHIFVDREDEAKWELFFERDVANYVKAREGLGAIYLNDF